MTPGIFREDFDGRRPRILVFAPHTCATRARSGIHRVVMRLIEHLPAEARIDLVKWDPIEGQLRYCDRADMRGFFAPGARPWGIDVHPLAHRVDYRFADTIPAEDDVVVLMPEVFYLVEDGNEIHARLIAQCIVAGWTTAAIFYDLIPLKSAGYESRDAHARYVAELMRLDLVLAISHCSKDALRTLYRRTFGLHDADLVQSRQQIVAIPLADRDTDESAPAPALQGDRRAILLLGTVEPRKQQVRVIRAFKRLQLASRAGLDLVVIGGLNPRVEADFRAAIDNEPHITWLGHATDAEIDETFARARFSVFASNEEGFGLPIVESLSRRVPCLTADFGAMREAADGGGCVIVDVDDDHALDDGLERLAFDDALLATCRREIDARAWRSWADYARDVAIALTQFETARRSSRSAAATLTEIVPHVLGGDRRWSRSSRPSGGLSLVVDVLDEEMDAGAEPTDGAIRIVVVPSGVDPRRLSQDAFGRLLEADAWFCIGREAHDAVIARGRDADRLLSGCCGWSTDAATLTALMVRRVGELAEGHLRRRVAACRDARFQAAFKRLRCPRGVPILTLAISTYNGAAFIERNIAHCLSLIAPLEGRVRLVVVDNASTDDTHARVEPFVRESGVEYVAVNCNTGLLGNLHLVSTLVRARHVWVIGVDDLIVPGALERILDVLDLDPACPFVMPNFAVFHRERIAPEEICASLLADSHPVGTKCDADGMIDVRRASSQHDNLLTAFYIIVFRSDLMAATFNYPFTAPFFGSLVDTVPTTKVIFESFAEYKAAWLCEPAIVGNAHNTWRHHRVAWHGVLMPQAFELAREVGVDSGLLKRWSRQHVDLLREAEELYPNPGVADAFPAEGRRASVRVFGADAWLPWAEARGSTAELACHNRVSGAIPSRLRPVASTSSMVQETQMTCKAMGMTVTVALALVAFATPTIRARADDTAAHFKIGIIGSGKVGGTLGTLWAKAGDDVLFSSRHPDELKGLATAAGPHARIGTPTEAAAFGDVVLIAVPYSVFSAVAEANGPVMKGKVVFDATNAIAARDGAIVKDVDAKGIGAYSAALLPGVHLVRGFNAINYKNMAADSNRAGEAVAIPIASDDPKAIAVGSALVRQAGFVPVVVPLKQAGEFGPGRPLGTGVFTAAQWKQKLGLAK